nr:Rho GTPase-activating protein 5-like [Tanacetum cinerariifolium]
MADPLTALMYAVQVMNFLKTLIVKTLREREDVIIEAVPASRFDHFDENNGPHHSLQGTIDETNEVEEEDQEFSVNEPAFENHENTSQDELTSESQSQSQVQNTLFEEVSGVGVAEGCSRVVEAPRRNSQSSNMNHKKSIRKNIDKSKGSTIVSRLNSRTERIEAWRTRGKKEYNVKDQ